MARSIYFQNGTRNEQRLLEDLIIESIQHKGLDFYYIPRNLVAKDEILGEDRLSQFKHAFNVEMYLESVDGFEGSQSFMSKFGLQIQQSATLTVAKRSWEKCVGRYGVTILPERPCEGDLVYFPMTDTLLEIRYVQYQNPFYQLGKTYVYKLQVETFQYASEHIETGIAAIDAFETLKSYDVNPTVTEFGSVTAVNVMNPGARYRRVPNVTITGDGAGAVVKAVLNGDKISGFVIEEGGLGYNTAPTVTIDPPYTSGEISIALGVDVTGVTDLVSFINNLGYSNTNTQAALAMIQGAVRATANAEIKVDVDMPSSFGDNSKFKKKFVDMSFSEDNPFGEFR